jgi:hypothetical protein
MNKINWYLSNCIPAPDYPQAPSAKFQDIPPNLKISRLCSHTLLSMVGKKFIISSFHYFIE